MVPDGCKRFLATDVSAYAARYEDVVVFALFRAEAAVGLALEYVIFVAGLGIAFDVSVLSQDIDLMVDEQELRSAIHVKTPFLRRVGTYLSAIVTPCIEVAVVLCNGIEDISRVHLLGTLGFERVALYYE